MQTIPVVTIDPHPVARAGLRSLLEHGDAGQGVSFRVVGDTGHADDIRDLVDRFKPQLILTEATVLLRGKPEKTVDVSNTLKGVIDPLQTWVIYYTWQEESNFLNQAHAIGALDYLMKGQPWEEVLTSIRNSVTAGKTPKESVLSQYVKKKMSTSHDQDIPLTNREIQVVRHLGFGLSNREIGHALNISIETVKEHVQNILRKLEVGGRTEAAVWAVRKGLV
jgi:DNA-binding NarL/FixJ family response regulator